MPIVHRLLPILCGLFLASCAAPTPETQAPEPTIPPSTSPSTSTPKPIVAPTKPPQPAQGQVLPITATAKVVSSGKVFKLEVAKTEAEQEMGLMYRESLPDDQGMLFEFDPPQSVRFWMKNCRMNLDMIFLRRGVVKAIAKDVPPCEKSPCPTYGTATEIDQVIEIRGGLADEIGLKEGDEMVVKAINY